MFSVKSITNGLAILIFTLLSSGCASHSIGTNGNVTKRYIGWIEVTGKLKQETFEKKIDEGRIERVRALGLRIANGFSAGYFDDTALTLPLDCRLVIIVKTIEQIRQISEVYPQLLKTENLCIKSIDF